MIISKVEKKRVKTRKRVAAYARVSTLTEEQESSFETQKAYYSSLIESHEEWDFVGMYSDQGVSGTCASKRSGFQSMINDALAGEIDIILVKSISRFARNAMEAQEYVLLLKEHRVEVRFDEESLSSFDPTAEMIFNLLSGMAQAEMKSLSEKVKWTNERKLEEGIRKIGSRHVLGYSEHDGKLTPNEDAWIVQQAFEDFYRGMTFAEVADHLNKVGAKTLRVGALFKPSDIKRMLRTVIYVGDRYLQQKPPANYLTHKPDYSASYKSKYIENDHEGIIDRPLWNAVQKMLDEIDEEHRNGIYHRPNEHYLYGKIICGDCNSPYVRKTVLSKGERIKVWKCKGRLKGDCRNCIIKEETILECVAKELGLPPTKRIIEQCVGHIIVLPSGALEIELYDTESQMAV